MPASPPVQGLAEIESLNLAGLDEDKKPVTPRLSDVTKALALFTTLMQADEKSSVARARIDAMYDGAPPYDPAKLTATNQAGRINLNFNQALRNLDISTSAFIDLYSSLETFVEVRGTIGEPSQRMVWEAIVAKELTNMLRDWPGFHSNYVRLVTTFIKHGVSVAFFDKPDGWQFRVGGFQDILIPRQSLASETHVDVAIGRRPYLLHELQSYIQNEEEATAMGWDVDEVKRIMVANVRTTGRTDSTNSYTDSEAVQQEFKNNDLYMGYQNPEVSVLHFWVRELNGKVSHLMAAESNPQAFIYKKIGRFDSPERAYIFFTYGTGTNGTYHSIRGQGQRIFAHIQILNRLRSAQAEGAMLASQVILQPESQRALDELQFTSWGPFSVLSPGLEIQERAVPNLTQSVRPAIEDLNMQLDLNTDTLSPYGQQASPYRSQMQVASDMEVSTRLSGSTINLFQASWTRLLREVVRRIVSGKQDVTTRNFRKRCMEQGVPDEFLRSLDLDRTRAVRSAGNGSQAHRMLSLNKLQSLSGQYPEQGRRNLVRDITVAEVGPDLADRYCPVEDMELTTVDTKLAILENHELSRGIPIAPLATELQITHLDQHLPALEGLLKQFNEGTLDPMQSLPAVQAYYEHIANHADFAAGDPVLMGMAGGIKKLLNFAEEVIYNMSKAAQAMMREREENGQEDPGAAQAFNEKAAMAELRVQEHKARMSSNWERAQLDMKIREEKFLQEQRLRDAEMAMKLTRAQMGVGVG